MAMEVVVEVRQNGFPYLFAQVQAARQQSLKWKNRFQYECERYAAYARCVYNLRVFCFVLFYQLLLLLSLIAVVVQ